MIKIDTDNLAKAIERAKALRPRVSVINADERTYRVAGSQGDSYTVRFAIADGMKLAECSCKAGQNNMVCYHVASAAAVNIAVQSMRRTVPAPVATCVATRRRSADWAGIRNGNAMILENGWAV
jgi:hypothetical protein